MRVYELLNGVVQDPKIKNHFGLQECWTMYICKWIEEGDFLYGNRNTAIVAREQTSRDYAGIKE
jgi:hypothetical protein